MTSQASTSTSPVTSSTGTHGIASDFTYHPVLLPPAGCFDSAVAVMKWVQATTSALMASLPAPNNALCSLDAPVANPDKHVVILVSPEFGFNKFFSDADKAWRVNASRPVRWEYFQQVIKGLQAFIQQPRFNPVTIIVAVSAVVDYGPLPGGVGPGVKHLAENAVFVFNNKAPGFQRVSKYKRHNDDKFDSANFVDLHEDRIGETTLDSIDTPARQSEMKHTVENFGGPGKRLCVGVGTCLDATYSTFPDSQLIVLPAGLMLKRNTRDAHLGTMIVNDYGPWLQTDYAEPPVGIWTLQAEGARLYDPVEIDRICKAANPSFHYDWEDIRRKVDAKCHEHQQMPNDNNQRWINTLPELAVPSLGFAFNFKDAVGITWPLGILEGGWSFRQGDSIRLPGSGIICGPTHPLPNTHWPAVAAPMQIYTIDEKEGAALRVSLENAEIRAGSSANNRLIIWDIVNKELDLARSQNLPGWIWAKNVVDKIAARIANGSIPM